MKCDSNKGVLWIKEMEGAIKPVKDYYDIRSSLWFGGQVEVGKETVNISTTS